MLGSVRSGQRARKRGIPVRSPYWVSLSEVLGRTCVTYQQPSVCAQVSPDGGDVTHRPRLGRAVSYSNLYFIDLRVVVSVMEDSGF